MFSSFFRASLVALVASAVATSAAPAAPGGPSVRIRTSTPNTDVDGLLNLKVTMTIVNTGGETLKLLNDPRGSLHTFPENSFTITDSTGSQPSFNGARVKYNPKYAAGLDDPSVFTVLAPGDSVNVTHDLSTAYDFTRSGTGDYTIKPSNLFTYVNADGTPKNLYATIEDAAKVKLSGKLSVSRAHYKRATFNDCSSSQQSDIELAASNAHVYASTATNFLTGLSSSTELYTTWFGTYHDSRKGTVQEHFSLISSRDFSGFTYNCTCTEPTLFAYVYPDEFGTIYICGAFWNATAIDLNSKAGMLVHESSHFTVNGGNEDYAYGLEDCLTLASTNPDQAVFNADSYEYFVESGPYLS